MEPLPDDILKFLHSFIASVEHLEILRILGEEPTREWTADEMRLRAQVSEGSIRARLQELQQRGLIRCRLNEVQLFCQYGPQSTELAEKLGRLLDLYRQKPVTTIRTVYERPSSALRDFSDAFRLRDKE